MWDEIAETFDRALEVPPADREAWLAEHSSGDVRREVAAMLREYEPLELEGELLAERDHAFAEGTRLGNYRIKRWLGQGGMGEVYLAARADVDFEQLVAVKVLRVQIRGHDAAARFRRERRILAHLNHPAVVPLLDSGVTLDGRPYLVLQYVEGEPITRYCDAHRLPLDARLRLFVDVCRAVQYAHGRLIIHRDLKPSNIMVTPDGEPRLLDFGVAKALAPEEEETELTHREPAPMTPERAAPEQLCGELPSTATDVWALGVLLYELAAGKLPFAVTGRSRAEIERAITRDPEPLRLRFRGDLDTVIAVALRREPEQRYASAGQLADDVERVLAGQPILARPHRLGYRIRRFAGRNRGAVVASTLALVSLIAFTIATVLQSRQVVRERDRAAGEEVKANGVVDLLVEVLGAASPAEDARSRTLDVEELLARGEKRARELDEQPAVRARLWHVLGKIQLERSNFAKARELLSLAHACQLEVASAGEMRTIEMALDLAMVEQQLRLTTAATARLRDAVARLDADPEADPLVKAAALNQLGALMAGSEGERMIERALALRRAADPPRPVMVAGSLNSLGVLAFQRGDCKAAAGHWRDALNLLIPDRGADHPHVLSVQANLALAVSDWNEQEVLYRSLVAAHEKRFGRDSAQTATAWNNLGVALARKGDLEAARAALGESLDRWTHMVGRDHPQALNTRRSIARIFELSGHPEEALREMQAIIAAARRQKDSLREADFRGQSAAVLLRLGRLEEAERVARAAQSDLERLEPEGGTARDGARFNLGLVLLAQGRAAEAERELASALKIAGRRFRPDDPRIAELRVALGRALMANGRVADGRRLLEQAIEPFAGYGLAHPDDVASARRALQEGQMSGTAP